MVFVARMSACEPIGLVGPRGTSALRVQSDQSFAACCRPHCEHRRLQRGMRSWHTGVVFWAWNGCVAASSSKLAVARGDVKGAAADVIGQVGHFGGYIATQVPVATKVKVPRYTSEQAKFGRDWPTELVVMEAEVVCECCQLPELRWYRPELTRITVIEIMDHSSKL